MPRIECFSLFLLCGDGGGCGSCRWWSSRSVGRGSDVVRSHVCEKTFCVFGLSHIVRARHILVRSSLMLKILKIETKYGNNMYVNYI